jgi:hypothetical protein
MTIRNTDLGGATDWSDGQTLTAADLNDTFDEAVKRIQNTSTGHDHDGTDSKVVGRDKIMEVSTSATLNFNLTAAGTAETSLVMSDISSANINLYQANYVEIMLRGYMYLQNSGSADHRIDFKYQVKELPSGSYIDVIAYNRVHENISLGADSGRTFYKEVVYSHLHTLTANEKTNGISIKLWLKAVTDDIYDLSWTNRQIVITLRH